MMEMVSCPAPILVNDSCLDAWMRVGSGGFGQVYKARHLKLCCDVAIKLLHYDDGNCSSLLRELEMMRQGSSPYVIQVLGVFRGRPPTSGLSAQLGLVMEFMERGCLATLQERLCGAPPWPLVFRLAHQVALGINFLHNLSPPLLHLDLKPNNVLLDSYLKAKLTDFGLARVYHSVTRVSKRSSDTEGGTISYMPPEAFDLSYSPTKASDIYSFGILLWSIVSGKQPYQHALSSIVRLRIPQGDRPSLDHIRVQASGIAGLTGLMDLMEKCWETKPSVRPSSYNCTMMTEELFKLHKHAVNAAVLNVLQQLDQTPADRLTDQLQRVHVTQPSEDTVNGGYNVPTGRGPVQEVAGGGSLNQHPNRSRDQSIPLPVCVSDVSDKCPILKVSSVQPIEASPAASGTERIRGHQAAARQNGFSQYQRQFSSPDTLPNHHRHQPPPPGPHINIHCSNVTGLQCGNNNTMYIHSLDQSERKRHPTAPSRVNLPPQRKGSWKDKKGGVG